MKSKDLYRPSSINGSQKEETTSNNEKLETRQDSVTATINGAHEKTKSQTNSATQLQIGAVETKRTDKHVSSLSSSPASSAQEDSIHQAKLGPEKKKKMTKRRSRDDKSSRAEGALSRISNAGRKQPVKPFDDSSTCSSNHSEEDIFDPSNN